MSTNIVELLQNSFDSSVGNNIYLKVYLESCVEHGVFYPKNNVEFVVKTINTSLNSSFDKEKGLILLLAFLPQIDTDVFSNNATSWLIQCNKMIHQKGEYIDNLVLRVLRKLLKLSVKFPEINREAAKEIVPKFLLEQVKHRSSSQISIELLECVQTCMSEYSGPSGDFRTDILQLLLRLVERPLAVVEAAACCIPLVAQVGGGGKLGISYKTSWRSLHLGLISLLHILLNKIYIYLDCLMEVDTTHPEDPALTLELVTEENILVKTQRLTKQFISVAHYLQAMFLQEFPVAKSVAAEAVLDLISHAQKPTHSSLGVSTEALAVMSVLPSIQRSALHLLESLIFCLGRNLVPYAGLVNHLCTQPVVWTHKQHQEWPYAMEKPYSETRLSAYSCLQTWFTAVGAASRIETLIEKALPVMISDIYVQKPTVRLKVGAKTTKGKKRKQMLVNIEDRSDKLGDIAANSRLCVKALLTMEQIVNLTSPYLKADILMCIQDTVLMLCKELPVPYGEATCRSSLYQVLLALCLAHHPIVPRPLPSAISLFTTGIHHPDQQVKIVCLSALNSLEKLVHPTAATFYFPLSQESPKSLLKVMTEEEIDCSDCQEAENISKKRRIEPDDDTTSVISIVLDASDDNSSLKSLKVEIGEEKIDMNISDDSVGIVEVVSEESRSSLNDKKVSCENAVSDTIDSKTESTAITESLAKKVEQCIPADVDNSRSETKGTTDKDTIKCDGKSVPKETVTFDPLTNTDDVDVGLSQMLMDFNDEINNDI